MRLKLSNLEGNVIEYIYEFMGNEEIITNYNLVLDELMILYYFNNKKFKKKIYLKKDGDYMEILTSQILSKSCDLITTLKEKLSGSCYKIKMIENKFPNSLNYFEKLISYWTLLINNSMWNVIMPKRKCEMTINEIKNEIIHFKDETNEKNEIILQQIKDTKNDIGFYCNEFRRKLHEKEYDDYKNYILNNLYKNYKYTFEKLLKCKFIYPLVGYNKYYYNIICIVENLNLH